ncbi:MAG: glycosyltransferase [Pseudomonas sp.]
MLILANTLEFNGGSTFVLRFCRESARRGKKVGVLVMMDGPEEQLLEELRLCADVYFLSAYVLSPFGIAKTPFVGFMPLDMPSLSNIFKEHGDVVHLMGVFGLLFLSRVVRNISRRLCVSVGIYHQNEFMYDGVSYYFSKEAQRLFYALGKECVIFFNEITISAYSNFYGLDFACSTLVPIGVDLPVSPKPIIGNPVSRRIVSVGNLVEFKSYNSHVIKCMPALLQNDAGFRYEIYGEGPFEKELREIALRCGVSHAVEFKGRVPYGKFSSVLEGSFLFVGCGTSIIEAAALGVPALIGIESTKEAVTYGFLSEVDGYSYNEIGLNIPLYCFLGKILDVYESCDLWVEFAAACKSKTHSFSIEKTLDGFEHQALTLPEFTPLKVGGYSNVHALASLLVCTVKHLFGFDRTFSKRRNQGSIR